MKTHPAYTSSTEPRRSVRILPLVAAALLPVAGGAEQAVVGADEWSRPRSGERIVEMPGLRVVVEAWDRRPGTVIELRYPGGDDGVLWAEEIRDWLIALGVDSAHIRPMPGGPAADRVELLVVSGDAGW